jgi:hypothetical protein
MYVIELNLQQSTCNVLSTQLPVATWYQVVLGLDEASKLT